MRIYIDTQGTLSANVAGHSLQDCMQAAHDLGTVATVAIMSGDPEHAREMLGLGPLVVVLDKGDLFRGDLHGAMVVDDEPPILAAAVRAGACAVPAAMLLDVADAMVPSRRCDELFARRKCGHEYCPACEAEVSR